MRLFKHGHACVRIEHDDHVVVIDPGGFTEPEAVDGATAVLLTHEHADHVDIDNLRRTQAPIHTIGAVAAMLREQAPDVAERVTVVAPGERFGVGVPVEVVGDTHAEILPDLHFDNSGYLLDVDGTTVFHPGDALTVPKRRVDLLLLPVSAPWLKASECVAFATEVAAPRSLAVHDMIHSEAGLSVLDGHLRRILTPREQEYLRLPAGAGLA